MFEVLKRSPSNRESSATATQRPKPPKMQNAINWCMLLLVSSWLDFWGAGGRVVVVVWSS